MPQDILSLITSQPRPTRRITEIIIHCSATPQGRHVTAADIDRAHRARGFSGIGYHFVIYLDGSVHATRPLSRPGAHCHGHNYNSIGVCYIGGVADDRHLTPLDTRTPQQVSALRALVTHLRATFPTATVHGHCEFAHKACPSFNVKEAGLCD